MIPRQIDRYQILSECGHDSLSVVYQAFDPQLNSQVALKLFTAQPLNAASLRGVFKREIDDYARLRHPGIVPVYGYGMAQGQLYLVTRYLAGGSLAERLLSKNPMLVKDVQVVVNQVAPALDFYHQQGAVHRDLKPGNILFDEAGRAFLAGFGMAALIEKASELPGSQSSIPPDYQSPEQRQQSRTVDWRTDLYALGVIVFEMLFGVLPDELPVLPAQHKGNSPGSQLANRSLPVEYREFFARALAVDPDQRFSSAEEMSAALAGLAHPASPPDSEQWTSQEPQTRQPLSAPAARTPSPRPLEPKGERAGSGNQGAYPEPVPTPRPRQASFQLPQVPAFPGSPVSQTSLPSFLRPFARYLRLPSWLSRPSVPYLTVPARLRPFLGLFGVPSTIVLPRKLPSWIYPLVMIILLLVMCLALGAIGYWVIFLRPSLAGQGSGRALALLVVILREGVHPDAA